MRVAIVSLLVLSTVAACGGADETQPLPTAEAVPEATPLPDGTRENPFLGHGTIQEVGEGQLVIAHDTIPGFMGAMTMPYPVAPDAMDAALEPGQEVTFEVELLDPGFQIIRVERVE